MQLLLPAVHQAITLHRIQDRTQMEHLAIAVAAGVIVVVAREEEEAVREVVVEEDNLLFSIRSRYAFLK